MYKVTWIEFWNVIQVSKNIQIQILLPIYKRAHMFKDVQRYTAVDT